MKSRKKSKPKAITKYEYPSQYKLKRLKKAKMQLVKVLMKHLKVDKNEAIELIESDKVWKQYMDYENKKLIVKGLNELMPSLFNIAKKKADTGWTANAKDAVIAMSILKEKLVDYEKKTHALNIGGKNVQVNVGFGFKDYNKQNAKK